MMQIGLFDESDRLHKLRDLCDPLEKFNRVIDWGMFRPILERTFEKTRKCPKGRPPYPYLLMFKILVLQRLYNISDEQTEYQIADRMTFMRFLGLSINDRVPDANTIWLFRDNLVKAEVDKELFDLFERHLESHKLITDYILVSANVHDITEFERLIDPKKDNVIYGDSAFAGAEAAERTKTEAKKRGRKIKLKIIEKGCRGHPLTKTQKATNRKKASVRCFVEHVFGFIVNSMHGKNLRSIGIKRAKFNIGLRTRISLTL